MHDHMGYGGTYGADVLTSSRGMLQRTWGNDAHDTSDFKAAVDPEFLKARPNEKVKKTDV